MRRKTLLALFSVALLAGACQEEEDTKVQDTHNQDVNDQDVNDQDVNDQDVNDQDVNDQDVNDQETQEQDLAEDQQDQEILPDFGFDFRNPKQDYNIKCEGVGWDGSDVYYEGGDADWLCTFEYEGESGFVYLQATPVSCTTGMGAMPEFTTQAWFSDGISAVTLQQPGYDFGGNHQNSNFWFVYNNKKFFYDHSSYGYGYRVCQPMDCMRVAESSGQPILEDGCTKDRTLPIACVPIKADGTHDALVDTFAPCAGDPNYER